MTDRHYSLFANNQHPLQLDIYNSYNHMLRVMASEAHQARLSDTKDRLHELIEEKSETLNKDEGETISWDDF